MKAENWKNRIIFMVNHNDEKSLDLLAQLLVESDQAKQELRDKGYGWLGLSLLNTILEEVPCCEGVEI